MHTVTVIVSEASARTASARFAIVSLPCLSAAGGRSRRWKDVRVTAFESPLTRGGDLVRSRWSGSSRSGKRVSRVEIYVELGRISPFQLNCALVFTLFPPPHVWEASPAQG